MVRTEDGHAALASAFRDLLDAGRTLATTSYVLVETIALLQHRFGLEPIRDFERILRLLRVHWVDEELHRRGMDRLLKADRRKLSFVDCVSFCFMDREGIRDALALDQHFADEGYRPVTSP